MNKHQKLDVSPDLKSPLSNENALVNIRIHGGDNAALIKRIEERVLEFLAGDAMEWQREKANAILARVSQANANIRDGQPERNAPLFFILGHLFAEINYLERAHKGLGEEVRQRKAWIANEEKAKRRASQPSGLVRAAAEAILAYGENAADGRTQLKNLGRRIVAFENDDFRAPTLTEDQDGRETLDYEDARGKWCSVVSLKRTYTAANRLLREQQQK